MGESYDYTLDYYNNMLQNSQAILEEQKRTNQELNRLRQQMAHANAMQQQMLQNQIRDIEERETQKFYKLRSFKLNQLVTSIDSLTDINQKAFTYYVFKDAIMQNATDAQNNLNEISDKEYCNTIMSKVRDIYKQIGDVNQLEIATYLKMYVTGGNEYNNLCNNLKSTKAASNIPPLPKPEKPSNKTVKDETKREYGAIFILSGISLLITGLVVPQGVMALIGFFALIVGLVLIASKKTIPVTEEELNKYNETIKQIEEKHQETIANMRNKISEIESQIANCDYMKALKFFFTDHPEWKAEIDNCYKQLSYWFLFFS